MGIPLYFRFLTQKYPELICEYDKSKSFDYFFFDYNGLLHPASSKARKEYLESISDGGKDKTPSQKEMYNKILDEIKKKTTGLIDMIDPKLKLVLAVDGVAPLAKINQQRSRRYKSNIRNTMINRINEKYKKVIDKWDTNAISPGTPFMNQLMNDLEEFIKPNSKNILSSSKEYGEGEHKILKIIKNIDNTSKKLIYGLDADLIMLALSSGKDNIYLLRESIHFGKIEQDKYLILDIDLLREKLYQEILSFLDSPYLPKNIIIRDYIFICFFMGNDFLPSSPSLHISGGTIDYLLESYGKCINKHKTSLITDQESININILSDFLIELSREEDMMVKSFHQGYVRKKYLEKSGVDEYSREVRRLDFMPLIKKCVNTINYNEIGWRNRFYNLYFNDEYVSEIEINKMCSNYLDGLQWNIKYYNSGCPCWYWFYKYNCAPSLSDLLNFIKQDNYEEIKFSNTDPLKPVEQLLAILPPSSVELIPEKFRNLVISSESPIRDLYPDSFNLEMSYNTYFHEALPILPKIDIDRIKHAVSSIN